MGVTLALTIAAWAIAAAVAVPMLVFSAECLAGLVTAWSRPVVSASPPFTVLMPAHDEAAGIAASIAAVRAQLRARDRLLVVADNCSDATAAIARAAGAEVVERHDPLRRGKAYALDHGRCAMRDLPAVVIVLDADCQPAPGALAMLATTADARHAVVQGRYLLTAPAGAGVLTRLSVFAFRIKNAVRQRGLQRIGGCALLQGSGMAFPGEVFATAPLVSDNLVEDLELGIHLALTGCDVRFDDRARFVSAASPSSAAEAQRTRWEHGSVVTAARAVPRLFAAAVRGRISVLPLLLDLLVPPLALLVLVSGAAAATVAVLALAGGGLEPLYVLGATLSAFSVTVGLVWLGHGRDLLPARTLFDVPRYLVWKLPIYRRLAADRQRAWVRTARQP